MPALFAGPLAVLGMLLLLVTLPVTGPLAALLAWRERTGLRQAAARTRCTRCGTLLGMAAPDASDAAHIADLGAMQREHPTHHVYIVRRSQARCTACGADYAWDRRSRTLHLLDADP